MAADVAALRREMEATDLELRDRIKKAAVEHSGKRLELEVQAIELWARQTYRAIMEQSYPELSHVGKVRIPDNAGEREEGAESGLGVHG